MKEPLGRQAYRYVRKIISRKEKLEERRCKQKIRPAISILI